VCRYNKLVFFLGQRDEPKFAASMAGGDPFSTCGCCLRRKGASGGRCGADACCGPSPRRAPCWCARAPPDASAKLQLSAGPERMQILEQKNQLQSALEANEVSSFVYLIFKFNVKVGSISISKVSAI